MRLFTVAALAEAPRWSPAREDDLAQARAFLEPVVERRDLVARRGWRDVRLLGCTIEEPAP